MLLLSTKLRRTHNAMYADNQETRVQMYLYMVSCLISKLDQVHVKAHREQPDLPRNAISSPLPAKSGGKSTESTSSVLLFIIG